MTPLRPILVFLLLAGHALAAPSAIDDVTARRELARVLRDDGQIANAIAEYRKLLATDPQDTATTIELAEVLLWNKEPAESARLLATVPPAKLGATGQRVLGAIALDQGKFAAAEDHFAKALALAPEDDHTRFDYAQVLTWQKKFPAALAEYQRLLERHPNDIQLRRNYAQVLGWAGQRDAAIEQWRLTLTPAKP